MSARRPFRRSVLSGRKMGSGWARFSRLPPLPCPCFSLHSRDSSCQSAMPPLIGGFLACLPSLRSVSLSSSSTSLKPPTSPHPRTSRENLIRSQTPLTQGLQSRRSEGDTGTVGSRQRGWRIQGEKMVWFPALGFLLLVHLVAPQAPVSHTAFYLPPLYWLQCGISCISIYPPTWPIPPKLSFPLSYRKGKPYVWLH